MRHTSSKSLITPQKVQGLSFGYLFQWFMQIYLGLKPRFQKECKTSAPSRERLPWCHLSGTSWNSVWLLERSHATALPQVPGNQTILESPCILVVEKQAKAGRQMFATWLLLPCRWSSRKQDRRLAGTQQSWISCTFTIKQSKLLLFIWVWNCTKMAVTFQTSEKRSCWLGRLLIYLSFAEELKKLSGENYPLVL